MQSEDHAVVYLNDVIVTKKYDNYIYIRDETGSMLLFDRGDGQSGKRYGADVKAGDPLSGVTGRFINYFGVPEISPSEQFRVGQNQEVLPEQAPEIIDSIDVCRYLVLDSAVVTGWTSLTYNGQEYAVSNKFNLPSFDLNVPTRTFVIVSYDYDVVTLYIVRQEPYSGQGLDPITNDQLPISYEVVLARKDSFKLMQEASERQQDFQHDLLILTASRDYGLDDILFGPPERKAIQRALVPVMLVNPREDLFSLCD